MRYLSTLRLFKMLLWLLQPYHQLKSVLNDCSLFESDLKEVMEDLIKAILFSEQIYFQVVAHSKMLLSLTLI